MPDVQAHRVGFAKKNNTFGEENTKQHMVCESQIKGRLFLFPKTVWDICRDHSTSQLCWREDVNKTQNEQHFISNNGGNTQLLTQSYHLRGIYSNGMVTINT